MGVFDIRAHGYNCMPALAEWACVASNNHHITLRDATRFYRVRPDAAMYCEPEMGGDSTLGGTLHPKGGYSTRGDTPPSNNVASTVHFEFAKSG